jgi:hypothetical protein
MDRLLDEARIGAFYLRQPAIADMVIEAIQYNADILGHYALHAFVVMPSRSFNPFGDTLKRILFVRGWLRKPARIDGQARDGRPRGRPQTWGSAPLM